MHLVVIPVIAAIALVDVLAAGGLIGNYFETSLSSMAAWLGVTGAAYVVIALGLRDLPVPLAVNVPFGGAAP